MRAGRGIGQHVARVLQPWIDAGELVPVLPVLPDWRRPPMPFHILYPRNRHQNARLAVFTDWPQEPFRGQAGPSASADAGAGAGAVSARSPSP